MESKDSYFRNVSDEKHSRNEGLLNMNEDELEHFKAQLESLAMQIHADVMKQFEDRFRQMKIGGNEAEMPQVSFQTIYAAVLMKVAATLAVDSGIDRTKFGDIAYESWDNGYQAAPKFS